MFLLAGFLNWLCQNQNNKHIFEIVIVKMLQDWFENNQYVDYIDCYMLCQNIKFPVA